MLINRKLNDPNQQTSSSVLKKVRKSVYKQALLAGLLIILTVVILFAVTAAWYTNIIQSSGLVFEASVWGFTGDVTLHDEVISAAPGDEGVVALTAESDSDEITAVSVNVSKAQMKEAIQQRLFFYVDTSKTRNNETMERIYLGNQDSYTYLLFSHATLMLTESVHNDALLKWQWVYDVLGYYVQGTWDGTSMTVTEYLRPIEYNYDDSVTTFDSNGNLKTIDGTLTAGEFLYQLTQTDGYDGAILPTQAPNSGGYYPISVDENGNGVWAYLCTYSEIMLNTIYDTELGEAARDAVNSATEPETYVAKVTLSAQNSNMEAIQVNTPTALVAELTEALDSSNKTVIQLGSSMTLSDPLLIGNNSQTQQVMLDLNGNTLTIDSGSYSDKAAGIQVGEGSSLTLVNGDLAGTGDGFAIDGAGAEITLSNVNISKVECALYVRDSEATSGLNADAKVRLIGCNIECSEEGIYLSGNGTNSAQTTQLVVENTTINSGYIGVMSNGSENQAGTDIQIINSIINGKWAGVYHPQTNSTLTISNGSVISGYTGLALKGGTTNIIGSTIAGTGAQQEPTNLSLSGFCDTGDGIYIESNYGHEIILDISGTSSVTSTHGYALQVYPTTDNVHVAVHSGTFSTDLDSAFLAENMVCVPSNGVYVVEASSIT